MKISKQFPTKFIKAVDLEGRDITLTIARVVVERLGQGNQAEDKPVAYFGKTNKGLVLNATIARSIAVLYGDETDGWEGKRITVYPTRVKAFGETHDVVRVRPEIPAQPKSAATQPQPAAQVEENEIDDAEDFADLDEGPDPERQVDPATGEILDGKAFVADIWDEEHDPNPAKPTVVSPAQLTRITVLGADAYGKEYNGPKLAQWISKGSANRLEDLQQGEGDMLIKALEKKIKDDKALAAEKAAAKKQPVTTT